MSSLDILNRWLAPILGPFNQLPTHLNAMQQNHTDSVSNFQGLVASLVEAAPSGQQFSGMAAQNAIEAAGNYVQSERALAGVGGGTGLLERAEEAVTTYVADIE